jgi:hypothetical protein
MENAGMGEWIGITGSIWKIQSKNGGNISIKLMDFIERIGF